MAKAPRLGRAKTRLRGFLTDQEAETLAGAFFVDTVRHAQTTGLEIIIAFTPGGSSDELRSLIRTPDALIWTEQPDGDLGERLVAASEFARSSGLWPVVFLGTDSPNLPDDMVRSAIKQIEVGEADLVLGPCSDGGCYLIAYSRPSPELFQNVPWSTSEVFARMYSNAERLGYRITVLEAWYDVDEPEDLRRLSGDILANPSTAMATFDWLKQHSNITASEPGDTSDRECSG
jgi:uncharacterized protein